MAMIRPETEMKDSGVKWIGDIPESWTIRPLKSLYTLTTGFTPNSKDDSLYDENGETWVTIGDLKGDIIYNSKQKISKKVADMHRAEMTKQGSLMYSFKLSVGAVAVAGKDLFTNEAIASFLPKNRHGNLHYLKYASSLIIGNANTNIYGAFIMNQQLILNAPLPLPSPDEQQAIADYLDETCSKIDEIIAEAKASIDEYKELKQSVIFETVTKGLDKNVEMKDSGVEWIGKTNKNAVIKKIKYTSNISRGLFNYRPRNAEFLYGGIHPFIQTGDVAKANKYVTDYKQTLSDEGTKISKFFPKGTLTMTIAANVGDVSILGFDAYFPDSVLGITPFNKYSSEYLYYVFSSMKSEFVRVSISNTQLNLNVERVKELFVPIFEDSVVQKKIVEYLDEKCSTIDSLIAEKESLINDLEAYKKSLVYEVVTGKRRVV